jgi:hypothetical protein
MGHVRMRVSVEKNNGRVPLASAPFRFLRPFNGCVPQPEKKRRLFDSHNPNSLMVAELNARYHTYHPVGIRKD